MGNYIILLLFLVFLKSAARADSILLYHWGPKDHIGFKLDLSRFDFQGRSHYGELSDGRGSATDFGNWLNWAREKFYDQKGTNPYDAIGYQRGFTYGAGIYGSTNFLEFFRGKRNYPEDLLIVEITFPKGGNPLDGRHVFAGGSFFTAKANPSLRLGMERELPLLGKSADGLMAVIYRPPDHREPGVQVVLRPPNSDDVKRIWESNSRTQREALRFLSWLAEIMAPFNPVRRGSVLMGSKTRVVQIVFDRLYYDYGFEYFVNFLASNQENLSNEELVWLNSVKESYSQNLGLSQLDRLKLVLKNGLTACRQILF